MQEPFLSLTIWIVIIAVLTIAALTLKHAGVI